MAAPTRYPSGVNNAPANPANPLYGFPELSPFRLITDKSDFIEYTAAQWTTTVVGTGTSALIAAVGGVLQLITSATNADSVSTQRATTDMALLAGTNRFWFDCLFTPQIAGTPEILVGLCNATTTPLTATDGIWFHKAAGSATIDLVLSNASTQTTIAAIATLADATAVKLSFHYNSRGELMYYVNNVIAGRLTTVTNAPAAATLLAPTFFIKNGSANTRYLNVDYFMAATETGRL